MDGNDGAARHYPLLPLKNVVVFPRNVVTLLIGRARSIQAVEEAMNRDRLIVVTAYRPGADGDGDLGPDRLYTVGTLAKLERHERRQDSDSVQVVLEGLARVRIGQFDTSRPVCTVAADELREGETPIADADILIRIAKDLAGKYAESPNKLDPEVTAMIERATELGPLADLLATQFLTDTAGRQVLLELLDPAARLDRLAEVMPAEVAMAERVQEQVQARLAVARAALEGPNVSEPRSPATEARMAALEQRVARLESLVDKLGARQTEET
jgi:ATP-dependent Lon protease